MSDEGFLITIQSMMDVARDSAYLQNIISDADEGQVERGEEVEQTYQVKIYWA